MHHVSRHATRGPNDFEVKYMRLLLPGKWFKKNRQKKGSMHLALLPKRLRQVSFSLICPLFTFFFFLVAFAMFASFFIEELLQWAEANQETKIKMQQDQVFLPRWIIRQCALYPTNCPDDHARIWSVESPELSAAPRIHAPFPQLDQLYPRLDEPAANFPSALSKE